MGLLDFFQSGDAGGLSGLDGLSGLGGLLRNSAFGQNLDAGIGPDNAMYGQMPVGPSPGPYAPAAASGTNTVVAALPASAPFSLAGNTAAPTSPSATVPSPLSLGDRLSAGFQSWAHTPVGSPFEAIANGIQGLSTGQRNDTAALNQQKQDQTAQLLMKNGAPEDVVRAAQGNPDIMKLAVARYIAPRLRPSP